MTYSASEARKLPIKVRLRNYCDRIFAISAKFIIRNRLNSVYINSVTETLLKEHTNSEAKSIVPNVARRLEDQLIDICRDEIRNDVARRMGFQPLEAVIRNTIEDQLLPQLIPRVERAMRDAEQDIDAKFKSSLRSVIEECIGIDAMRLMLREEITKIARTLPLDKITQQDLPNPVASPQRKKHHKQFEEILGIVRNKNNILGSKVLMVGPAGSGKTLIAEDIAEALGLSFYFNGPVQSEFKLLGYKDAAGKYHYTQFRKAYEFGGVYLFDEFDACSAQAMVAFNTALSNRICDFPDGQVRQHDGFICLAAANTYGRGGTLKYSGRERLDGATLDRFVVCEIEYDRSLEEALANQDEWVEKVQQIRSIASESYPWLIISMRAAIEGARLLKKGYATDFVDNAVLWRGQLTKDQILDITRRVRL